MEDGFVNTEVDDEYEVIVVRYASRQTVRSQIYLNYHLYGEPDAPMGMDYYFWIVRNAQRTFVVDTGYSEQGGFNRGRGHLIHPREALKLTGVEPDEATLILTHAHYDHVGNADLFPHSPVIIPKREFDFWTGPYARRLQYHHSVENAELAHLRRIHDEGRMQFHTGSIEVAPGIEMIQLGGHSPGQSILTVKTSEGMVLLASDATHYYEEIDRDMPFLVVADLEAMYAGFDQMKRIVEERNAILIPGHDPQVLDRHEQYQGALAGVAASIGRLPLNKGSIDDKQR
ncbi:N-acyl homoserine lactonase family protein [Rhodococcus opacus]|nr:N-acyl homoserine lactonase family protein [Rhodococcus opacus]RKM76534.1 N-acyl homoserine lactonase family protein [Rhodococcus opacus]